MTLRTVAVAASTFACVALFSPGWSEQGGVSLSIGKAEGFDGLAVIQELRGRGLRFAPEAFEELVSEVGQDLRRLMGEVEIRRNGVGERHRLELAPH